MSDEQQNNRKKRFKTSIESLQKNLYKPGVDGVRIRSRSYLHPEHTEAPNNWQDKNNEELMSKKPKKIARFSVAQKIFFLSFLVFLFSAGFAFMTFYQNKNTVSSKNIEVAFDHVAFVDGGDELTVSVDITNKNNSPLMFTNMTLEYPSVTSANENGVERSSFTLDTLRPGETKTAEFAVVLYGEQGSQNDLRGIFQYRVEGSNATFEKVENSLVTLRSTPVDIVLDSSEQIIPNQEETYEFSIISLSEEPLSGLLFQIDVPPGFEVVDTSPISLFGNNTWSLGVMEPLEEKKITITGVMNGEEGQSKVLRAYVGTGDSISGRGITTVFNSLNKTVDLIEPFLRAELFVERSSDDVVSVSAGQKVTGTVRWENTLDEAIKSPEIFVYFSGGAYDKTTVEPQSGFFSSTENKIIWSKETLDSLRVIEPGEDGSVRFSVTPRQLSGLGFSSPEVNMRVGVRGVDSSGQLREATQTDQMKVQIGTVMDVLAETFYSTGPFNNNGPVPPRVGRTTEYTIRWTVTNSANPVERGRATATLPPYVEWRGETSPLNENIRYEETSRTVIWDLGDIAPGAGFGGSGRTAYFKVAITPSLTQVGETADLTSRVNIVGVDSYTNSGLSAQSRSATTRLLNDGNAYGTSGVSGRIVE